MRRKPKPNPNPDPFEEQDASEPTPPEEITEYFLVGIDDDGQFIILRFNDRKAIIRELNFTGGSLNMFPEGGGDYVSVHKLKRNLEMKGKELDHGSIVKFSPGESVFFLVKGKIVHPFEEWNIA